MKKETTAIWICILAAIAGYLLFKYQHWNWWGPFISGSSVMLLILATLGFRKNKKYTDALNKVINDAKS